MKVVLTESLGIPDQLLRTHAEKLERLGHTFFAYPKTNDIAALREEIRDADIVMLANMPMPEEALRACEHLKFVDIAFTGVDHVDVKTAHELGAVVSNASGYSNTAVSELAVCMMLSLLRNVSAAEKRCRDGKDKSGLVGSELRGKTVGIVGLGKIGLQTARLCQAFGCQVIGTSRSHTSGMTENIKCMPLEELLPRVDILSLHCPLNNQTKGMIGKKEMAAMKQGALLLNLARGPIVDTAALCEMLKSGHLGGAGLDVFEQEPPLPITHPLLHTPNTLATPHIAFASKESMALRAEIVFDNIQAFLQGQPQNIV